MKNTLNLLRGGSPIGILRFIHFIIWPTDIKSAITKCQMLIYALQEGAIQKLLIESLLQDSKQNRARRPYGLFQYFLHISTIEAERQSRRDRLSLPDRSATKSRSRSRGDGSDKYRFAAFDVYI